MPANEVKLRKEGIVDSGNEGLECFGAVQLGAINKGAPKPFYEEISIIHDKTLPPVLGFSLEAPPPPQWCLDLKIIPLPAVVPAVEFGPMPPLSPIPTLPLTPGIPPVYASPLPLSTTPPLTELLPPPATPLLLVTAYASIIPPGVFTHYSRAGTRYKISISGTINTTYLSEGVYSYVFYIHKGTDYTGFTTVPLPYGITPASRIARVGLGFTVFADT